MTQAKTRSSLLRHAKTLLVIVFSVSFLVAVSSLIVFYLLQSSPARLEYVLEKVGSWALNRELQIGELVEAQLNWDTYLVATDVTLANPEWAENANFIRVGELALRINLPSIWRKGLFIIDELDLADVSVELLGESENPANWEFWPTAEVEPIDVVASDDDVDLIFPVIIRDAHVSSGTLSYRDSNQNFILSIDQLKLKEPDPAAPIYLDLAGAIDEVPLTLEGHIGPSAALLGRRNLSMDLSIGLGKLSLIARGSIENLQTLSDPDLHLDISAPRSRRILKLFGITQIGDGPLSLKGHLTDAHPGLAVDIVGALDEIDVQISGTLIEPMKFKGVDLAFNFDGPSVRETGMLFGFEGLPDGPYLASGSIFRDDSGLGIRSGVLHIGEARMALNGRLPEFPEIDDWDLVLDVHNFNLALLGALLGVRNVPPALYDIKGRLESSVEGVELVALEVLGSKARMSLNGTVGEAPGYLGSTLKLGFTTEDLGLIAPWLGLELPSVPINISGAVSGGLQALKIDQMTISSGETVVKLSGDIGDLATKDGVDLKVSVVTPDVLKFVSLKGGDSAVHLPLNGSGHLVMTANGLGIKQVQATVGKGNVALEGLFNIEPPFNNSRFSVRANGPNLGAVLSPVLGREIPVLPFRLALNASFDNGGVELEQLEVTIAKAQLSAQISMAKFSDPTSAQGTFKLVGPSSRQLLKLLGIDPPIPDVNYSLSAGVKYSPNWLLLDPIAVQWGRGDLSGRVGYRPGDVAQIDVDLHSDVVDISFLRFSDEELRVKEAERAASSSKEGKALLSKELSRREQGERIIPDEPFDFSWLTKLEGSIKYKADEVYMDDNSRSEAIVDISLSKGVLSSQKLSWNGSFLIGEADVSLRSQSEGAELEVSLNMSRLPIFSILGGTPKYDPNAFYRATMKTRGKSWRQMAQHLNGEVVFRGGGARFDNAVSGLIMGDFTAELLSRINPLRETNRYTKLVCHSGGLSVHNGKVSLNPGVVVRTKRVDFLMGGELDLTTEALDFTFTSRSRKGLGISAGKAITPYFKLGGTLAHSRIVLDPKGVALSGSAAVATGGLSILAEGLWDRWVKTARNPCDTVIQSVGKSDNNSLKELLNAGD